MFLSEHRLKIASLRIGKHRIVKNIASLRKVNIAHPYPLLATPPPKRVKRGHLLSDYRQKCVNGTRDSYCGVKSPFLSDLRLILTHIVVSKDSY